eukprot:CAMPEP_0178456992 /NCGR_PEP_ID=MMETSP0689_2-20121128/46781_1 /TAXON_ID=160604 /ORGANISM="Amphidinium massartii, Strain CS-259" /LENGTH=442 /DNA_ID=CAMNT_0020083217 /DNA_START=46 /DNA_END=1374 /DNA_ORIENTATION=+
MSDQPPWKVASMPANPAQSSGHSVAVHRWQEAARQVSQPHVRSQLVSGVQVQSISGARCAAAPPQAAPQARPIHMGVTGTDGFNPAVRWGCPSGGHGVPDLSPTAAAAKSSQERAPMDRASLGPSPFETLAARNAHSSSVAAATACQSAPSAHKDHLRKVRREGGQEVSSALRALTPTSASKRAVTDGTTKDRAQGSQSLHSTAQARHADGEAYAEKKVDHLRNVKHHLEKQVKDLELKVDTLEQDKRKYQELYEKSQRGVADKTPTGRSTEGDALASHAGVHHDPEYLHRTNNWLCNVKHALEKQVKFLEGKVENLETVKSQYQELYEQSQRSWADRNNTSPELEISNLHDQLNAMILLKDFMEQENLKLRHELESLSRPAGEESATRSSVCVVCLDNLVNLVCLPCKHLAMCSYCGQKKELKECPICRAKITEKMQIYTP